MYDITVSKSRLLGRGAHKLGETAIADETLQYNKSQHNRKILLKWSNVIVDSASNFMVKQNASSLIQLVIWSNTDFVNSRFVEILKRNIWNIAQTSVNLMNTLKF